jgi:hypothetical protein
VPQLYLFYSVQWVVPEKIHSPLGTEEISTVQRGGERKLFLIIVSVLGHSNFEGDRGLTSNYDINYDNTRTNFNQGLGCATTLGPPIRNKVQSL